MKQIVIKKWIDGEFREVKRYSEEEVVSIRHHTDGLEIILKGNIRLYDTQCIIEFVEYSGNDNIGNRLLNWFKDCKWDAVDNGTLKRDDIIAWIEKRVEKLVWSEEDERIRYAICDTLDRIDERIMEHNNQLTHQQVKDWFKSLKERYVWKPSEEMLQALYKVVPDNVKEMSEDEMLLDKLYQNLKEL